nr:MAG TPA: hypothetical protein [Caudoviricetes sp.]
MDVSKRINNLIRFHQVRSGPERPISGKSGITSDVTLASCCRICYIENTKRETASGYPDYNVKLLYNSRHYSQ